VADQPTCGQGLAQHAAVPAKLAELIAAQGRNLEAHMPSLDLGDPASRRERDVYVALADAHRALAADLRAAGEEMAAQQDLPLGRHDPERLASSEAVEAFEAYVRAERELLTLLEEQLEQHQAMLAERES
jgi:hypothetical protein